MWLPNGIYEALPAIYIAIGAVFMAGSWYLGFRTSLAPFYLGIGVALAVSGVFVHLLRKQARSRRRPSSDESS